MAYENDQRGRGPDSEEKIEKKPSRPYENRQGDDDDPNTSEKVKRILEGD